MTASFNVFEGDALTVLKSLPDGCVDCCVTSPPYFGLRDYGTASWEGGDPACDHRQETAHQKQGETSQRKGRANAEAQRNENFRNVCGKCGALRVDPQIGLEPTPEAFVEKLVEVFREVRRVLRETGTLWLNLGDSYCTRPNGSIGASTLEGSHHNALEYRLAHGLRSRGRALSGGTKHKDLLGIPWMVAFALRADGWYLRQDIIWHKPNPMPESVTDRCTKAHEYLFLLAKSDRYYFDSQAMQEPSVHPRGPGNIKPIKRLPGEREGENANVRGALHEIGPRETRNKRSVWTVTTRPFKGAHFATFPPSLIEPCILAGCPADGLVLDPFTGSGTTGAVAVQHGRHFLGIELNPEYARMAEARITESL